MSLSKSEKQSIIEFFQYLGFKAEQSPYRPGSIRVRVEDDLFLIHDAEFVDKDNYIEWVQEMRQESADKRIARRVAKVKEKLLLMPSTHANNPISDAILYGQTILRR